MLISGQELDFKLNHECWSVHDALWSENVSSVVWKCAKTGITREVVLFERSGNGRLQHVSRISHRPRYPRKNQELEKNFPKKTISQRGQLVDYLCMFSLIKKILTPVKEENPLSLTYDGWTSPLTLKLLTNSLLHSKQVMFFETHANKRLGNKISEVRVGCSWKHRRPA